MLTRMLALLLLATGLARAADLETDIIYSARASELQPVLATLAAPEGSVGVYQDQLVIRATPDKLRLIRETLQTLDRPLRNLRISVRRREQSHDSRQELGARGRLRVDDGKVGGHVELRAAQHSEDGAQGSGYSITAEEGSTVLVASGSDIPLLSVIGTGGGIVTSTQYVPVQSGMQVTPRLLPDGSVSLEVRVQQAAPGPGAVIDRDVTQTRMKARLGEWTPLSGIEQSIETSRRGSAGLQQRSAQRSVPLEILVEALP